MKESEYLTDFSPWLEKVKDLPIFRSLDLERVKLLLTRCRVRKYEPGEPIIEEGDNDGWVYILASGEAVVEKGGAVLAELRRLGDVFGEMRHTEGLPRSATVRAVTRVLCMALDFSLMEAMPPADRVLFQAILYRVLAESLGEKLRQTDAELVRTKNLIYNLERTVEIKGRLLEKYRAMFGSTP